MATVTRGGKVRTVRNLGWLLKHATEVERFVITPDPGGGAHMTAHLSGGGTYDTGWASLTVLQDWIKRPSFCGTPIAWDGES